MGPWRETHSEGEGRRQWGKRSKLREIKERQGEVGKGRREGSGPGKQNERRQERKRGGPGTVEQREEVRRYGTGDRVRTGGTHTRERPPHTQRGWSTRPTGEEIILNLFHELIHVPFTTVLGEREPNYAPLTYEETEARGSM